MTHLHALERHKERVQIMGIVNRTPDSFFDGGAFLEERPAKGHVRRLVEEGADIVDLGAESTRPGAAAVSAAEQIDRLGDLVGFARQLGAVVSVDTTLAEVAAWGLEQGARMINSVSLAPAAELGALAAEHGARLVLTHCRGPMTAMQGFSVHEDDDYDDVVAEVAREWSQAAAEALGRGLPAADLIFDPGLGFTKNAQQSLELCARLDEFGTLGHPILVGTSRKSYIAHVAAEQLDGPVAPPAERLGGSIAAALGCARRGAGYLRVHDVAATRQALAYATALGHVADAPGAAASTSSRERGGHRA